MLQAVLVSLLCFVMAAYSGAVNVRIFRNEINAEEVVVKDVFQHECHRVSYDERGGSVHADDSTINPAKKSLHYQLDMPSGGTL